MKMNRILKYGLSVLALAGLTTSARAYTINVAEAENCTVNISPVRDSYSIGEAITVTITPNNGCTFDSFELFYECSETEYWEVQSSMSRRRNIPAPRRASRFSYRLESFYFNDEYEDEYREVTEGREYTFTMPARNVEIEVIYLSSGSEEYDVAVVQTDNGTTSVDKTKANAGDIVTITATGSVGYMASEVRVYEQEKVGSTIYETLLDNVTIVNATHYTFAMPANPVRIQVTYSKSALGDVNWDGSITIADVTALLNIILGKDTAGAYNHAAADVNADGDITIDDVIALVNIILGNVSTSAQP